MYAIPVFVDVRLLNIMPNDIFNILVMEFNVCWKIRHLKFFEDVQRECVHYIGYELCMYWIGRVDLVSPNLMPVFFWITKVFGHPDIRNYTDVSEKIIICLFNKYASMTSLPPHKPKKNFLPRLLKIFKNI